MVVARAAGRLLAGGGPVITTLTGGTGEALDRVVLEMPEHERRDLEHRGREHALAFDRGRVFDDLFFPDLTPGPAQPGSAIHFSTVSAIAISCATSVVDGKPSMRNHVSWPDRAVCPAAHNARSLYDRNGTSSGLAAEEQSRQTMTHRSPTAPTVRPTSGNRGPQ